MSTKKNQEELPFELQFQIDKFVSGKLKQIASVIGVVNIIALASIYFSVTSFVAERAAEAASKTAIENTKNQMEATTTQLNNLTKDALDKAVSASVASLSAEKQAKEAISSIEVINGLELDEVSKFLTLFQKSEDEVKTIVDIDAQFNAIRSTTDDLSEKVEDSQADLLGAYERIKTLNTRISELSTVAANATSVSASMNGLIIISGSSVTPKDGTGVATVSFNEAFKETPYVVASTYNNAINSDGHPVIFDITPSGFKVKVIRYEQKAIGADVQFKPDANFSFIAIGLGKDS